MVQIYTSTFHILHTLVELIWHVLAAAKEPWLNPQQNIL
jgi:hypothetical protein